jgi:hypothetical protein
VHSLGGAAKFRLWELDGRPARVQAAASAVTRR